MASTNQKKGTDMRKSFIIGAVFSLGVSAASAQTQNPPAQSGPNNPAVNTTQGNIANQPVAGANSFTEGQARSRIEENGFTNCQGSRRTTTASRAAGR